MADPTLSPARYYDGETARARPVALRLEAARLIIIAHDEDARVLDSWSIADIRRVDDAEDDSCAGATGGAPLRLKRGEFGAARLIVDDPELVAALCAAAPRLQPRRTRWRWPAAIAALAASVVIAAILFSGIEWVTAAAARLIPVAWEAPIGERTIRAMLVTMGRRERICTAPAGQAALDALLARLTRRVDSVYAFRARVTSHDAINAFATLGGEIVLFHGLIAFARTPDEVAGVLAHEIGHLIHRHPTQAMIRVLGVDLVLNLLAGGGALEGAGGTMLELSYSREAESEADAAAIALLTGAGIRTDGFATLFRRLKKKEGDIPSALRFLSTHPPLEARAERAEALGRSGGSPAMSAEEWQALRRICG